MNRELMFGSKEHTQVLEALLVRKKIAKEVVDKKKGDWQAIDKFCDFVIPEKDADAIRRSDREAGNPQYTTLQIPYSYAQMLTAHTYFSSVLLGRNPIWQVMGQHGEGEMNIKAMEALLDYQTMNGEHLGPLYIWLMDIAKYGIGVMMTHWDKDIGYVSQLEEVPVSIGGELILGKTEMRRKVTEVHGFEGNRLSNVSLYDVLPDPRVGIAKIQKGEFFGRLIRINWNSYLQGTIEKRYYNREVVEKQLKNANASGLIAGLFEQDRDENPGMVNQAYQHNRSSLVSQLPGFEMTVEIIPSEWGLGPTERPEKWQFTVLDDRVIIESRPLGCLHNQFPFTVGELEMDGYKRFPRGYIEMGAPMNNVLDWLINSHFYAVRKDLNGSMIYDPSKVVAADLLRNTPGSRIRLHPNAYGQDVRTAVHMLSGGPSLTGTHLRDTDLIMTMMQRVLGVSESGMGALPMSSRRTATEVRSSSAASVTRLKTLTEFLGSTAFTPLARMLVKNSQQYYQAEKKLLIAGDQVSNPGGFIDVTPDMIAGSYMYSPVDGSLPVDRFAQVTMWTQLFTQMQRMPQLAMEYRIGDIFAWVAQLAGLKNIKQFKVQVLPPGAGLDPNGASYGQLRGGQPNGSGGPAGFSGGGSGQAPVIPLAPQAPGMGRAI